MKKEKPSTKKEKPSVIKEKPSPKKTGKKDKLNSRSAIAEKVKDINSSNNPFPVVGIGASAGGLEALDEFFANMPVNSGMAFVVIQHLDPNYAGIMPQLLQKATTMTVYQATDRMKIKPDCVYVIPSNKSMSILKGALHLFEPVETRGLRLPIDFFFRSLADDLEDNSIGIILSGMGSDGSIGLRAIKEKNGIVIVQDPSSAKFDSMPRNAIDTVMVDVIAPADEIPSKLLAIARHHPLRKGSEAEPVKDTSSLEKILILLRSHTGNDFSQYKKNTMYRRIERRMSIHQLGKISSYVKYLQANPSELDILFKEFLIGVTGFFRDNAIWEYMRDHVLVQYLEELPNDYTLRAWVPGCSTGEEAFSLAIIFMEALKKMKGNRNLSLQIFATDIDSNAIEQARKGIYPANIISDVSPERLNNYFIKSNDQFRLSSAIREMVIFATQNVIKDPPFTKLDIISCRNMLIYMDSSLQKKLLSLFHYTLNHRGIMVLGSAETSGDLKDMFAPINSKMRIYRTIGSVKTDELFSFPSFYSSKKTRPGGDQNQEKFSDNVQTLTDQLLLQQFSPASVLVTLQGDILYITGNVGKYLTPSAGKASMNLFAMAKEGLRNDLSLAFHKATQSYEKIIINNIKVGTEGGTHMVDVNIQQLDKPPALRGRFIVVFSDTPPAKKRTSKSKSINNVDKELYDELKMELQRTQEELQSLREEMQTSQEELKSTNEELQSSNEELQSTNEELTTSKEEMQSLNEELHTVNTELQSKIDDSVRMNNDMNNLLNSSEIATLFLDRSFKIRQFTPATTRIFKLIQSDIGRPFTDQVSDLIYPEMYDDATEVLRTLVFIEKSVPTRDGRWFNIRIMPYRTYEEKIDGLVITFIDISKSKSLENSLLISQRALRSFIRAVPSVIIGLSPDGKILEFNKEAEMLFNLKYEDVIGKSYVDTFISAEFQSEIKTDFEKLLKGGKQEKIQNIVKTSNNIEIKIEWSLHNIYDETGKHCGFIVVGINIS